MLKWTWLLPGLPHLGSILCQDCQPKGQFVCLLSDFSRSGVTLFICEPFRIKNELPFAIHLRAAKDAKALQSPTSPPAQMEAVRLEPGAHGHISKFPRSQLLFLQVVIPGKLASTMLLKIIDYLWSDAVPIDQGDHGVIPLYQAHDTSRSNPIAIEYEIRYADAIYATLTNPSQGHDIRLYSPFIIQNYTEFTMLYYNTRKAIAAQSDGIGVIHIKY